MNRAAPDATDILAAALEQHQAGRHDQAEPLYRRALEASPNEPTALYLYGLMVFEAGRADQAADLFEQVVALRPDHAEAQVTLANLRHWRGEHGAAVAGYRRAMALDPGRADAAVGLVNALRESGEARAAVEAGEAAAAQFPGHAAARLALGAALFAAGDLEAAAGAYRSAADLDPRLIGARTGLALALLDAGQPEAAIAEAGAALDLDPILAEAWFARGAAALALRRPDEAIVALEWASSIDPSRAATQLTLGAAYAEANRADAAERCLKAALALDPTLAAAHASLSSVYLRAEREAAAERHARQALAIDPDMLVAHQNLASLLAGQGDPAGARRHRDLAYRGRNLFVEPAPRPRLTVLMPTTAESGNVPLDHLMPRDRFSRLRWVVEYAGPDQARNLPAYDLVFNAIGDPDLAGPTAEPLRRFLAGCERPVLNAPAAVARTRRDGMPALLGDLPGVLVPAVARISAAAIAQEGLAGPIERAGLTLPVLVRPVGSHGGKGLRLAATMTDLQAQAAAGDHYVTAFQDYRSADGRFRKYRVVFVDRRPYPYHLAISPDWLVHHESAGMAADPIRRAEEQRFVEDPHAVLGPAAMTAIGAIGARLDLDYAGVDFSVLPDGRVLVFEANATMLVHPEAHDGVFAYKNRAVAAIVEAFEAMLMSAV
ncbi:MAG TPA: tetratricopeptide repeat protein [Caulobacteraceae bacterium]|jgi:tetratricopeptide (TPR) repeat protein|nr:tetratricopeptide repeat protein [Caulobacteraceae bacterium]